MNWLTRLYYGFLGIWFGAFIAEIVGAISAFSMVRYAEAVPGKAPFNDPKFQEYGADIVGGFVANRIFNILHVVELICFVALLLIILVHAKKGFKLKQLPIMMIVFAGLSIAMTFLWITPEMSGLKDTMYNPAIEEAARTVARESFQWYHKLTEKLITLAGIAVLIAMNVKNVKE